MEVSAVTSCRQLSQALGIQELEKNDILDVTMLSCSNSNAAIDSFTVNKSVYITQSYTWMCTSRVSALWPQLYISNIAHSTFSSVVCICTGRVSYCAECIVMIVAITC
jgi:hypothetical protein